MDFLYHERLARSDEALERLRALPIMLCGAGALGANLAENLVRQGFGTLRVIDQDRIEERNLSTQPYGRGAIGQLKARQLGSQLFRELGVEVEAQPVTLTSDNARKLLRGAALVIDTFDNSVGRRAVTEYCTATATPCLHVGMAAGYAEVLWNDGYRVPSAAHDDHCDYALARNLVLLTVAVAAETIVRWVIDGEETAWTITLDDLAVRPLGVP